MPYVIKRRPRKNRKVIDIVQDKFSKGYISTIDNSRRPTDSLSDMTNMEIVQDGVARPRPPLTRYGAQPTLPVIGRGHIRQGGNRSLLFMMNVSGTGKLYKQTDGGSFSLIGGTYDDEAWASCVQSTGKAYIYNGVDKLSYVKLSDNSIKVYTGLATPTAPTVTMNGATSTGFTYYYKITANNEVGESIASAAGSDTTNKPRDNWVEGTDFMALTWAVVSGATSYTVYVSDDPTECRELYTVKETTFTDYGTLAPNPYKLFPSGDTTQGAVFTWMHVDSKNSQIYGITADNKLYYSAPALDDKSADFSPYNGGGWVAINEDGGTQLNYVDGFRNGKGDPVITVSARGAAGMGKLFHVTFESLTVGDQIIVFPNVYESNGQSGTYAPRATLKERDSLYYFTGQDVRSTGTSQNIVNILTTTSISQVIEPDIAKISLQNLHKAVGVAYRDKLYFALPVASTENNEIWVLDLSRRNIWTLRWTVPAKDLWLYEDNSGYTHFCALVGNKILEFTRSGAQPHQDDGVAFRSRVAFESMTWDKGGIILGKIRSMYFKFLFPKGTMQINTTGLTRLGASTSTGSDTFTVTTTPTFIGQWEYSTHQIGADPGNINTFGKSVSLITIKPKGLLAELQWEVIGETAGTDYTLSAVNTKGTAMEDLVLK